MKSIIHMLDGTSSLIIIIVTDNVWWEPQRPPKGRTKQWPTQKPYSESRGVNFIRISKFIQLVIHSTNQVPIIVQLLYNTGNRTVNLSTPTITDIQCIWIILFSSILPLKNIGEKGKEREQAGRLSVFRTEQKYMSVCVSYST